MFLKSQPKLNTVLQELIWFYEPSCKPAAKDAWQQNARPARVAGETATLLHALGSILPEGIWVLSPCWHSEVLQCYLPGTQGFPQSTQQGWRNTLLPFLGAGWQHLSQDFGKAFSVSSALSISARPLCFNKPFWFTLSSPSLYQAPSCIPLEDGCGCLCHPKPSHPRANRSLKPPGIQGPQLLVCSQVLSLDQMGLWSPSHKGASETAALQKPINRVKRNQFGCNLCWETCLAPAEMLSLFQPGILLPSRESSISSWHPPAPPATPQPILNTP